jgi:hypothetical protein
MNVVRDAFYLPQMNPRLKELISMILIRSNLSVGEVVVLPK